MSEAMPPWMEVADGFAQGPVQGFVFLSDWSQPHGCHVQLEGEKNS